jgi:gamma-glutamyltranspeptidase
MDAENVLISRGHEIRRRVDIGNVQLIRRKKGISTFNSADSIDAGYTAASDPRKGGVPAGIE